MTRKRDRRGAAPLPPRRETRRPEGAARTKRAVVPATQPDTRPAPREAQREWPRERREADVARIYGFHSVEAALKAPRRELIRLYASSAAAERLQPEIAARGIEVRIMSLEEIAARAPREAVHQGVLLEARPLAPIDLSELPAKGLVIVLDQITDPHNVGAILRTAAAFAVDALVTTERHSPEFSGALAKSASGGLEHVPICTVVNLARALDEMGDMGYLRVGLDSEGPVPLARVVLSRPLALALGAEGKGLRRLTRERCDVLARLDLPGAIKSLNVSNACAIALALAYETLEAEG
jgi:23S rRNA (guanosine2251-2'-O)-methyltransferase